MSEGNSVGEEVRGPADEEKIRFGQVAIHLGYINRKQLKIALGLQKKIRDENGEAPALGDLLVRKGYLSEKQRQHVYEKQGKLGGHTHIPGYELKKKIGSGSMGTVYKAIQVKMKRTVAIKVLAPRLALKDEYIERFMNEGKSVARLNHPNIIQGIDAGASNGVHYFVMEFIDGPTVQELIGAQGQLTGSETLKILKQITKALAHAYKKDMVHRDVKPENIMVNSSEVAKLCDLGLAAVTSRKPENPGVGTPHYVAPEQVLDSKQINIQSDIYSLGVSCYHMMTGEVPFPGTDPKSVMKKQVQAEPEPPSQHQDDISKPVDDLVLKMMSKDRQQRHETPSDLLEHIDAVQKGETKSSSRTGSDGPSRRRRRRRRNRRR